MLSEMAATNAGSLLDKISLHCSITSSMASSVNAYPLEARHFSYSISEFIYSSQVSNTVKYSLTSFSSYKAYSDKISGNSN